MAPKVWLYKKHMHTIRVVQRDSGTASELLVFGPAGERRDERFTSTVQASNFQRLLQRQIIGRGFTLAWASGDEQAI
jgi:hypothetical protein